MIHHSGTSVHPTPSLPKRRYHVKDAERELLRLAARAHGIGTADDLADYYRMPVLDARPRLAELVESGELSVVKVESWRQPAYLHRDARLPKRMEAASLLSPFDPLIWYRKRVARLFELAGHYGTSRRAVEHAGRFARQLESNEVIRRIEIIFTRLVDHADEATERGNRIR
jgi:Winged helix DNA-binding domain